MVGHKSPYPKPLKHLNEKSRLNENSEFFFKIFLLLKSVICFEMLKSSEHEKL